MKELTDVRPNDEGGIIGLSGLKYQNHFAAKKCLEMVLNPGLIEYVASELHEDIVVKLKNETYDFYQVKGRKGRLWTINSLKHVNVWGGFLRCKKEFGEGHTYWFVSNKDCENRVSNRPDLGRMKILTDTTKPLCNENDLNDVDQIIKTLKKEIAFENDVQAISFFWNTRIINENMRALIFENLNVIEKILIDRSLPSDQVNREQVYKEIIYMIEDSLVPNNPTATLREILETRKIVSQDVHNCFDIPFKTTNNSHFDLSADNKRTLIQKMEDAGFPNPLKKYFLESRNRFTIRLLKDSVHSADYLDDLRWKVWSICVEKSQPDSTSGGYFALYESIKSELKTLAINESQSFTEITIDYDYLHGMLCQLTAECNHEWAFYEEK